MADYYVKNIESSAENQNNTKVFHFNMYIPYQDEFLWIRNQFPSYSVMIIFLLSKYAQRLQRIAEKKSGSRKTYQPTSGDYQGQSIRITDEAHQMLNDFAYWTGLSMSYLIRLLIEWERNDYRDPIGDIGYIFDCELDNSLVIIITEIEAKHIFSRNMERVQETFRVQFENGIEPF